MTRQILFAVLLLVAGPAWAQSELEGSPIHPSPLRIVPSQALTPVAPAASADRPPAQADKRTVSKKPAKKRQP